MRVGILLSHPTQYHTPWFQELAKLSGLDIQVFYCLQPNAIQQGVDFDVEFQWDLPLLEGYKSSFLKNVAAHPGFHFGGCNTPEIREIIRRREFDLWLLNGWRVFSDWQAIRACWRYNVPMLVRGDSHLLDHRPLHIRAAKRLLLGRWIPRFTRYLTVGKLNEEYYKFYGADPANFFSVKHFIDNERFARQANLKDSERSELRERWNAPEGATCFLFAGKFIEKKSPMDLLKAVEVLVSCGQRVHLLMVGDGKLRSSCESYAKQKQLPVSFTGFLNQSEIAQAYAVADVLVLPSVFGETWGLVVNEAMACGLPAIVSSRVGCAPDLIRHNETGFIFEAGDVSNLVEKMKIYCDGKDIAPSHGRAAKFLIQGFSVRAAAANTRAAVQSLCLS